MLRTQRSERRRGVPIQSQLRSAVLLLGLWGFGALVLAIASLQSATPLDRLFLDPAYISGQPWYTGMLSDFGILAWTVAAAAAGGGAWVAYQTGRPSAGAFLASSAAVTTVLLADDLLQLRAAVLPDLGVDKHAAEVLVVLPALVWIVLERHEIARTRWLLLAGSLAGFGISVMVDAAANPSADAVTGLFVEDGAKFLGVLAWAQYFVVTTADITRSTIRDARAANEPEGHDDAALVAAGATPSAD